MLQGYMNCTDPQESDLLILNTCSIRDKAEQKVYSALGPHAKRKRRDPNFRIVVAGCVAQQEGEALLRYNDCSEMVPLECKNKKMCYGRA